MKKIRLVDNTELEIYNIFDNGNILVIDILNADANSTEAMFSNTENLTIIQYYVGTELLKAYAGYTQMQEYRKKLAQTIAIDYSTPDAGTASGFVESKADILTVTLVKPAPIVEVAEQTQQNTADIDYIAMETGVNV